MELSKENLKFFKEASERMEVLGIYQGYIFLFLSESKVMMSDNGIIKDVPKEILDKIAEFQNEFGNLVYHVIHTHIFGMETYECLTVSPYEEDWDYERPDKDGWTMSHSINVTVPEYTKSGSIQIKNIDGLRRIN